MKKLIAGVHYCDVIELTEILGMSRHGIGAFIRTGKLEAIKIGRRFWVSEASIKDFIDQAKVTPSKEGEDKK